MTDFRLKDNFGFQAEFSPINDLKVNQPYRLVGSTFGSTIDTQFWTASTSGADSASGVATGFATITSGTANNGYGSLISSRTGRFLFVHPHLFRTALRVTALSKADCTRRWGAYSVTSVIVPSNGFFFSLDGENVLSVNKVSSGNITSVSSGSFNGLASTYTMDTNVHAYEIMFFEMGAWFYIDGVLIHKFTPTTSKLCADFSTPITFTSLNSSSGVTSGSMEVWASSLLRLGRDITAPKYSRITNASTNTLKIGAGTLHRITLNSPSGTLITMYDNTTASGTIIGVIDAPSQANPLTLHYGVDFTNGLTIVTTGTWDLTVMYE